MRRERLARETLRGAAFISLLAPDSTVNFCVAKIAVPTNPFRYAKKVD